MILDILTPDKKVFSGEIISVAVPGKKGSFEVLNFHASVISTLDNGKMRVKTKSATHDYMVKGGVIEVLQNKVVVLAEALEELS